MIYIKQLSKPERSYEFVHNLLNNNLKILYKKNFLLWEYFDKFNVFNSNILTNLTINYNFKLNKYNTQFIYFLYNKLLNKFTITNKNNYIKHYFFKFTIILKKLITSCKILRKNFTINNTIYKNFIYNVLSIFYKNINKNYIKKLNLNNKKNKYNSLIILNINKNINTFKYINTVSGSYYYNYDEILKFLTLYYKNKKKKDIMSNFYNFTTNLIFGQDKNMKQISNKLLNLTYNKSSKPIANWLFCGPSGTGKTELSKIIAKYIYRTNKNLIHLDMSEYKESHSIARLIGASPGYVGSDVNQNFVTDVINQPKSVVLFDEIEKASVEIYPIFLQILDEGILTDSKGNIGKFDKSIIIFTSNLGSDIFKYIDINKTYNTNYEDQIKDSIKDHISPEFLNRLDSIIIFKSLNINDVYSIFNKLINDSYNAEIKKQFKNTISLVSCSPVKGSRFLLNNTNIIKSSIDEDENIILYNNKLIKCLTV